MSMQNVDWKVVGVVMGALIVLAITFMVLFRDQVEEFLQKAQFRIRLRLFGILDLDIDPLQQMQKRIVDTGIVPFSENIDVANIDLTGADLLARDTVLKNWESLKQIVNDAALSRKIQLLPESGLTDVLARLVNASLISKQLADSIRILYEAGEKIAEYPGKRLSRKYAMVYQWLTEKLIAWIRRNIIAPPPSAVKPPPPPRRTQVGGYFPAPGVGAAAAILVGTKGPVRGKQFPVEKELFRIGAAPENDLVLPSDDYVSAKHAIIRYDKGSLVLADQHSHNGTFLNEHRLKDVALTLTPGDHIRVGNSTFEVVQAPGR